MGMRYWRAVVMLAVACPVILSLACGGGETNAVEVTVSASEGASLATDSGRFVLDIPPGAVSEDTEVRIELFNPEDLPEHVREATGEGPGWRLEPTGLQLREPATITLTVDSEDLVQGGEEPGSSAYFLVSVSNDGTQEVLDEVETLYAADGSVRVTAQLNHFSWIRRTKGGVKAVLEQYEPRKRASGTPFKVRFGVGFIVPSRKAPDYAVSITAARISSTGAVKTIITGSIISGEPTHEAPPGGGHSVLGGFGSEVMREIRVTQFDAIRAYHVLTKEGIQYYVPLGDSLPRRIATFSCEKKGPGTYFLELKGRQWGSGYPKTGRRLRLILEAQVDCLVPLDIPMPTPTPTPKSPPVAPPTQVATPPTAPPTGVQAVRENEVQILQSAVIDKMDPFDGIEKKTMWWQLQLDGKPLIKRDVVMKVVFPTHEGGEDELVYTRTTDEQGNLHLFFDARSLETAPNPPGIIRATIVSVKPHQRKPDAAYNGDGDELTINRS